MRHLAHKLEGFLLLITSPLFGKRISPIARKTARKISARSWLVRAGHAEFVAVVELRHAAGGQNKCIRQFEAGNSCTLLAHEAPIIVAAQQRHKYVRV